MNKKSQVMQIVLFMSILITLTFAGIITYYIMDKFYDSMDEMNMNTPEMLQAQNTMKVQIKTVDYAIIFLMIALIGGLIVTSFFIPSHPIFFVINIIGIFVLIFVGMVISNTYGEMVTSQDAIDNGIADAAETMMPFSSWFINYLPYIGAILIGIISIVMYAKGQGGGSY
jgi:hypothetical protein